MENKKMTMSLLLSEDKRMIIVTKARINEEYQIEAINENNGKEYKISINDIERENNMTFSAIISKKLGDWISADEEMKKISERRKRVMKSYENGNKQTIMRKLNIKPPQK